MARSRRARADDSAIPAGLKRFLGNRMSEIMGLSILFAAVCIALSLATWSVDDPSLNYAVAKDPQNLLGYPGAVIADLLMQMFGLGVVGLIVPMIAWSTRWLGHSEIGKPFKRSFACLCGAAALAGFMSVFSAPASWPLPTGLGGVIGDMIAGPLLVLFSVFLGSGFAAVVSGIVLLSIGASLVLFGCGFTSSELVMSAELLGEQIGEIVSRVLGRFGHIALSIAGAVVRIVNFFKHTRTKRERPEIEEPGESLRDRWRDLMASLFEPVEEPAAAPVVSRVEPHFGEGEVVGDMTEPPPLPANDDHDEEDWDRSEPKLRITRSTKEIREASAPGRKVAAKGDDFALPPLPLLVQPPASTAANQVSDATLAENARILEGVLEDFGVRGDIINVRPGPVVTLYELEPAPGIKSSRVIGLADDIARSMSAISARVAVVPGRNVIGIELPNIQRETVYLRELLASEDFAETKSDLTLALGKDIGGQPILSDLARMPHLLIAGTTGSGKSVGINTMILSLLFRLPPDRCKLILIDPKMLELSVYDGIPHLLAPVVTDPKKAVVALKWTVREMEDRYRKMSKIGVRNVHGYNQRISDALEKGEVLTRSVHTGYDPNSGEPIYEEEEMDLEMMPFIVVIIDRDGGSDDGRGQGHRGRGTAAGADGARRRHSYGNGHPAPECRRHNRHHQSQFPDPDQFPGDLQDRQPDNSW